MHIFKSHEVIPIISKLLPTDPIIVEAGAFHGHDTVRLAHQWPQGAIHAFEPVPELFAKLQEKTSTLKNVHCHQLALSNHNGTETFYMAQKPEKPGIATQAGSLLPPKERLKHSPIQFPSTIEVQTITIDSWAAHHRIERIDCLWLDMQGTELAVLKSAPKILKTVSVIYTEVAFIESYQNIPLMAEVKAWIESQGFVEYGCDFENETDWFFGNILFHRKHY